MNLRDQITELRQRIQEQNERLSEFEVARRVSVDKLAEAEAELAELTDTDGSPAAVDQWLTQTEQKLVAELAEVTKQLDAEEEQ